MNQRPRIIRAVRPSLCANPFEGRARIGEARAAILYRHWLPGEVTPYVLRCAGFSIDEAEAIERWRQRLLAELPVIRNAILRCICPPWAKWCHVPILQQFAAEAA